MAYLTQILTGFKWYRSKMTPMIQKLKMTPKNNPLCRPMAPQSNMPKYFHQRSANGPLRQSTGESRLILDQEFTVQNDTLLYRNTDRRFFKLLNVFAMSQFFFWTYLSHFAFTMMRDVPVKEEDKSNPHLPWWRKMNFGNFRNGIAVGCFMIGWGTMAIAWMYTLRSVRYLVLKKGGENLLFVTFAPFSHNRYLAVPLSRVSAKQSRASSKVYLPMKVKGKYMHYLLDMRGEFLNAKLFDYSAGLKRNWAK